MQNPTFPIHYQASSQHTSDYSLAFTACGLVFNQRLYLHQLRQLVSLITCQHCLAVLSKASLERETYEESQS